MTRRDLGKTVGAAALFQTHAAAADTSPYTGALDGFLDKVNGAGFDPVLFSHKLYESAPLRLSFQATNRQAADQWQKNLRSKVTELIGGVSNTRPPRQSHAPPIPRHPRLH